MKKRRKTVVIDGARYFAERPRECRNCFFWKNRKTGCILGKENCYFLAEAGKSDQEKKCENCPYAKAHPCVSASRNVNLISAEIVMQAINDSAII